MHSSDTYNTMAEAIRLSTYKKMSWCMSTDRLISYLVGYFKAGDERFDEERFRRACKVERRSHSGHSTILR